MTMPAMAYISFALSLIFIVMWLINPLSYLPREENHSKKMVRKVNRQGNSKQKQRGKAQSVRRQ